VTGFCNEEGVCLLRDADCVLKYDSG